jgi:L-rhamnose mutarotase
MQRIGLQLRVRTDRLDEYKKLHNPIWADLAAELRAAGMRNYSLWLDDDGIEFGYLECDDWAATCAYLSKCDVHTRWQALMQDYLKTETDASQGGQPVKLLEQIFMLE